MLLWSRQTFECGGGSGAKQDSPTLRVGPSSQEQGFLLGQQEFCCVAQGPQVGPSGGIRSLSPGDRCLTT